MSIEKAKFGIPKSLEVFEEYNPEQEKNIEYIDERPENEKSKIPILFAPGMAGDFEALRDSIKILADSSGQRVLSPAHPKEKLIERDENIIGTVEIQKALTLLRILEKEGIDKVDLVATSEGALNAISLALLMPGKIRNLVLVNPAGMSGKQNIVRLLFNSIMEKRKTEKELKDEPEALKKFQDFMKRSALSRKGNPEYTKEVAKAISKMEINSALEMLRKYGISISVIHDARDKLFSMKKMQKKTDAAQVDGFYSTKGGHYNFMTHPEKFMPLVSEALRALEEKIQIKFVDPSSGDKFWEASNHKYGPLGTIKERGISEYVELKDDKKIKRNKKVVFKAIELDGHIIPVDYGSVEEAASALKEAHAKKQIKEKL